MNTCILPLTVALLALAAGADDLLGQSPTTSASGLPTRVPVTVVLVDRLPLSGAPFLVQRRPDAEPHDVILLRTDAGERELSDAIRTLLVARLVGGDTAKSVATLRIRQRQGSHGVPRDFPWVPRVLADLRRAELQEVRGVGQVRAVKIWLPRQARSGPRGR